MQSEHRKWRSVGIQLPSALAESFRQVANNEEPQRGIKLLGAAGIALILALPPEVRSFLRDWAADLERRPHLAGDLKSLLEGVVLAIHDAAERRAHGTEQISKDAEWFLDRILDPAFLAKLAERPPPAVRGKSRGDDRGESDQRTRRSAVG